MSMRIQVEFDSTCESPFVRMLYLIPTECRTIKQVSDGVSSRLPNKTIVDLSIGGFALPSDESVAIIREDDIILATAAAIDPSPVLHTTVDSDLSPQCIAGSDTFTRTSTAELSLAETYGSINSVTYPNPTHTRFQTDNTISKSPGVVTTPVDSQTRKQMKKRKDFRFHAQEGLLSAKGDNLAKGTLLGKDEMPPVGSRISYNRLELSEVTWTPEISGRQHAIVLSILDHSISLRLDDGQVQTISRDELYNLRTAKIDVATSRKPRRRRVKRTTFQTITPDIREALDAKRRALAQK